MDIAQQIRPGLEAVGALPAGARIVVGVSGGGDSVCLLHVLHALQVPVIAAHFDHGLRRSSWADGRHVLRLAADLGIPAAAERLEPGRLAEGPGSVEDRARRARYRFLASVARQWSCQVIAVGHTQDDQAETVLMHLLRGSGTRGLSGMRPACPLNEITGAAEDSSLLLLRPLLPIPRRETLAYCRDQGLSIRRDPTNDQIVFLRNRVRLELLPLLEKYNPAIREALARTADILAGDAEALDSLPDLLASVLMRSANGDQIEVPTGWLVAQSPGLQRTVLRRVLAEVCPEGTEIGYQAVERARGALDTRKRTSLPGDVEVWAEGDRLVFSRRGAPGSAAPAFPQLSEDAGTDLAVPSKVPLKGGWMLEIASKEVAEPIEAVGADPRTEAVFDADALGLGLVLRSTIHGDRMTTFGAQGSKKVADLLREHRIPVEARAAWPVVCAGGSIAWLVGVRRAEGARVGPSTRRMLHLRLRAPGSGA